jgi:cytoskeletal protein RodZ
MKSRQSGNAHLVIVIIFVAVILGLLGVVFWQHFLQPKAATTESTSTSNATAADTVKAIASQVTTKYGTSTTKETTNLTTAGAPPYKISSADYYVAPATGASFSIMDTAAGVDYTKLSTPVDADIDSYLTTNRFDKSTPDASLGISYYETAYVICEVVQNISPASVNCADKSEYADVDDAVGPFAKAYASTLSDNSAQKTVYGSPAISDSVTSGYQTAHLEISSYDQPVGGFAGLFYKKGDAAWTYFTGAQGVLDCSQFNTSDVEAAYAGTECYNGSTQSTVQ